MYKIPITAGDFSDECPCTGPLGFGSGAGSVLSVIRGRFRARLQPEARPALPARPTLASDRGVDRWQWKAHRKTSSWTLCRLEETYEESERRLKQLTESRLPTEREIEAALTLSKSLPMLDIEIRRLRAEFAKARAARAAGEEKSPDPSSSN